MNNPNAIKNNKKQGIHTKMDEKQQKLFNSAKLPLEDFIYEHGHTNEERKVILSAWVGLIVQSYIQYFGVRPTAELFYKTADNMVGLLPLEETFQVKPELLKQAMKKIKLDDDILLDTTKRKSKTTTTKKQ